MAAKYTITKDGKGLKVVSDTFNKWVNLVGASLNVSGTTISVIGSSASFQLLFTDVDTNLAGGSIPNGYPDIAAAYSDYSAALKAANPDTP